MPGVQAILIKCTRTISEKEKECNNKEEEKNDFY